MTHVVHPRGSPIEVVLSTVRRPDRRTMTGSIAGKP